MKLATLFSGIGAPEQGAMRVHDEVETIFACEWDKFARQSYNAIYGINEDIFYKDVNDLDATQYKGQIEVLVGGSPCQSFSIAGLRKGTTEDRGQLIYQYIRVVNECRPEVIVYENVKGIMSIDGGRTIKDFVQALRDIGYHCHYEVVNTKHYGVPQNRERLFLVGFLCADAYHRYKMANKIHLTKRLRDVLEDAVDEKYYLNRKLNETYESQANTIHNIDKPSSTLCTFTHGYAGGYIKIPSATKLGYETAREGDSINLAIPNSKTRRGRVGKQVSQCLDTSCNQAVVLGMLDMKGMDQIRRVHSVDGICPTLTSMQGGNQEPKIVASRGRNKDNPSDRTAGAEVEQRLEVNENGTSNAITTVQKDNYVLEPRIGVYERTEEGKRKRKDYELGKTKHGFKEHRKLTPSKKTTSNTISTVTNDNLVITNRIRKLTPLECWRLQDFPDSAFNKAKKSGVSDSQLYKQAGNSMSVNILEMIFRQIVKAQNGIIDNTLF